MLLDTSHNRTSTVVANMFEALKAEAAKCLQAARRLRMDARHTRFLVGESTRLSKNDASVVRALTRAHAVDTVRQLATAAFAMTRSRGHGVRRAQYRCSVGRRCIYRYGILQFPRRVHGWEGVEK